MDGQSEVVNSMVLDLLKDYVNEVDHHNQGEKYLPLVEYAYTKSSPNLEDALRHLCYK